MDRVLAAGVVSLIGFAVLIVPYAGLARFVLHGEVTSDSLRTSVENAAGSVSLPGSRCVRDRPPRLWRCEVGDSGGSGGVTYRVQVRPNSSCWDAQVVGTLTGEFMPAKRRRLRHAMAVVTPLIGCGR